MKFAVVRNMVPGEIRLTERAIGSWLQDPFFDNYEEEDLTTRDILNLIADSREITITITIDRNFLKKIVRSHLRAIQAMKDENAR